MSWPPLCPPAMSFQGEWGPLWAVHSPPLKCQACRGLSVGLLWLQGAEGPEAQQAVISSHAALLFRSVLRDGAYALFAPGAAL